MSQGTNEPVVSDATVAHLADLLEAELKAIPIDDWRFMMPGHVAVWRLIESSVPGVLGPLNASLGDEPQFEGQGAEWFVSVLLERADYLDAVEAIMKAAVDQLDRGTMDRGSLRHDQRLVLPAEEIRSLARTAISSARSEASPASA